MTSLDLWLYWVCSWPFSGPTQSTISFAPNCSFWVPLQTLLNLPLALSQFLAGWDWPVSGQILQTHFAQLTAFFCGFLGWLTLRPWRWRWYVPLKHWAISKLCSVTTQETVLFIVTTTRTSNPGGRFNFTVSSVKYCIILVWK
jgi:hypothetical protein